MRYSAALALATHPSESRDRRVLALAQAKGFDPVDIATALTNPQTPAASAYLRKIAGQGTEDGRVTAWKALSPNMQKAEVDLAEKRLPGETEWVQLKIALALIRARDPKGASFVKRYSDQHPGWKWKRNVELAFKRQNRPQ